MKLSVPQQQVADDPRRFKVVIAGRRFGKTFLAIRQLCWHAKEPNQEIFYITSSYRSAKMIVWKPLKKRLLDLRWVKKINESTLSIELKNGSTISLKGGENPDSLRGPSLSYVVIDEVSEVDSELFFEVIRPALADQEGGALFIGTPKGKGNWSYDLYCMGQDNPDDWVSFQFKTIDGGFVKAKEIEAARRDMSERQFRQEFEATFETFEGRVAWAFEREHHVRTLDNPDTSTLYLGCDFNVSPITAVISVRVGDSLYAIDEILMYSSNTQELCEEVKTRYPKSKIWAYPDPAGSARSTKSNQTDHSILSNAGFVVKAPRAHTPVKDRINAFNARLCSSNGVRRLFVDPKCKYTIESLEKYCFKEGSSMIPDKDSGFDHIFDAFSYCVDYLWPLRKDTPEYKPQRWGHRLATH
jgi:hypothetical protein